MTRMKVISTGILSRILSLLHLIGVTLVLPQRSQIIYAFSKRKRALSFELLSVLRYTVVTYTIFGFDRISLVAT
jgi:hypothetical protein